MEYFTDIDEEKRSSDKISKMIGKIIDAVKDDIVDEPTEYGFSSNPINTYKALYILDGDKKTTIANIGKYLINRDIVCGFIDRNCGLVVDVKKSNNVCAAKLLTELETM